MSCKLILIVPYWPRIPWFAIYAKLAIKPNVEITSHPRLPYTGKQSMCISQETRVSETIRLASIKQSVRHLGFSRAVSSRIAHFANWCKNKGVDPLSCPKLKVTDFLIYLFEDYKIVRGTIANYKSTTIAFTWYLCGNASLVQNKSIQDLLRSFYIERHRPTNNIPPWNLSLVLDAFRKPPVGPMANINLPNITIRTVFLVAIKWQRVAVAVNSMLLPLEDQVWLVIFTLSNDCLFLTKLGRLHRQD